MIVNIWVSQLNGSYSTSKVIHLRVLPADTYIIQMMDSWIKDIPLSRFVNLLETLQKTSGQGYFIPSSPHIFKSIRGHSGVPEFHESVSV